MRRDCRLQVTDILLNKEMVVHWTVIWVVPNAREKFLPLPEMESCHPYHSRRYTLRYPALFMFPDLLIYRSYLDWLLYGFERADETDERHKNTWRLIQRLKMDVYRDIETRTLHGRISATAISSWSRSSSLCRSFRIVAYIIRLLPKHNKWGRQHTSNPAAALHRILKYFTHKVVK